MTGHTVTPSAFLSGAWTDFPGEVFEGDAIRITRGLTEQGELRAAKIQWRFNDQTGKWRPTNPTSPLYGQVGQALPVRVTVDGSTRAYCEAVSFAPDQDPEFQPGVRGRRWVDMSAEGLLGRIGTWSEAVRSAMYRQISGYANRRGHWPLEDPSSATQLTNTYSRGTPGVINGSRPGSDDGPPGADNVTAAPSGSSMGGRFSGVSGSGWQFSFSCRLNAMPAGSTYGELIRWTTSIGNTWSWQVNSTTFRLVVTAPDGTTLLNSIASFGGTISPAGWLTYRVKVTLSGSTVTVEPAWFGLNDGPLGITDSYVGGLGSLTSWTQETNAITQDALYGHVFGVTGTSDDLQSSGALQVFRGYLGETTGARFARLMTEAGIDYAFLGTASTPMGPQRSDTLIELLKEIARTEDGLIYDSRVALRLVLRSRPSLYNQAPLTLTLAQIAPSMREMIDLDGVFNRVTVSQREGGEASAALEAGPLSIQPAPAGIGEFKREVKVNVAAEGTLPLLAGWWISRGTARGRGGRYPEITVDLDAQPGLTSAVNGVEIGSRIVVTGRDPDPVGLLVLGIDETVQAFRRLVTFTCVPDHVWNPGVYHGTARYDTRATLAEDLTLTETLWDITAPTLADTFSRTSLPYDVMVGGERCTVTAATVPAGTGPYTQTITCTRSVNGVVKTQPLGAEIHIATPGRWAL
jgi:hypothetical protein